MSALLMHREDVKSNMDGEEKLKKIGRPRKKDINLEAQFARLLETVDYVFDTTGEIKATANELELSTVKVKKLLITSGKLEYDETKQIQRLLAYGKNLADIQIELGLKKSSINSYLPYSKVPYKESEVTANADRCLLYRKRKDAVMEIKDSTSLWRCIDLFQDYRFGSSEEDQFKYTLNKDEDGKCILELRADKFSGITYIKADDIDKAYEKLAMSRGKEGVRTEDLGGKDVSRFILAIFRRFGMASDRVPVTT